MDLSSQTINENVSVGSLVGALSTVDANLVDFFTYTLVSGTGDTDNAKFQISGANLQSAVALNFEAQEFYSVRIRSRA